MIPKRIIIDCLCVLFGTNIGSKIKNRIPQRIKTPMNVVFGLSAMAIGMTSIIKFHSLPAIILALILGALIGEIIDLDSKVNHIFH